MGSRIEKVTLIIAFGFGGAHSKGADVDNIFLVATGYKQTF